MGLADRDYMKSPWWRRRQAAWEGGAPIGATTPSSAAQGMAGVNLLRPRTPRARARLRRRLPAYLLALVVGLGGLGVAYAAGAQLGPFAPPPVLTWAERDFASKAEFDAWLRERGLSYRVWAERHPAAAARLEARDAAR